VDNGSFINARYIIYRRQKATISMRLANFPSKLGEMRQNRYYAYARKRGPGHEARALSLGEETPKGG
jgi:hypothetical protein